MDAAPGFFIRADVDYENCGSSPGVCRERTDSFTDQSETGQLGGVGVLRDEALFSCGLGFHHA